MSFLHLVDVLVEFFVFHSRLKLLRLEPWTCHTELPIHKGLIVRHMVDGETGQRCKARAVELIEDRRLDCSLVDDGDSAVFVFDILLLDLGQECSRCWQSKHCQVDKD